MKRFLKVIFGICIAVIGFLLILWLISNDKQKAQLNEWYKIAARPLQQLGIPVPVSLKTELTGSPTLDSWEGVRLSACGRVKSEDIDHSYRVFEWRDVSGQMLISDMPPSTGYSSLRVKELYVENFFDLSIDASQANLPAFTQDHIQAGVSKTYRTFRDVIHVAELRKIQLKLKFIGDKNAFHAYRLQVAPETSNKATGFYTSRFNQSTIWAVGDKHHLTRITLHEATHAMVAAMFGDMPVWMNEGLAGFFEKMVITGEQTYRFATNDEHLVLLRSSRLPSLKAHFSQSRDEWYSNEKIDLNYAIDWSLMFFLMSRNDGLQLLRYMLDNLAINYCQKFDANSFINQHYVGGMNRLESEWRQWLKTTTSGTVTF